MNSCIINLIINLFFINFILSADYKFYPNLPAGAYRLSFKGILSCQHSENYNLKKNWYLSKKSINSTEIKGNFTSKIAFDDSLNIEINMSVKDLIGGWKDNAYFYKSSKACTTFKNLLGNAWIPIMNGLGINNATCPIPAGIYIAPGADTSLFQYTNFPKNFFYGLYKFRLSYTKNNVIDGCIIYIIDIIRPWESI